jgi:hypothetical protein
MMIYYNFRDRDLMEKNYTTSRYNFIKLKESEYYPLNNIISTIDNLELYNFRFPVKQHSSQNIVIRKFINVGDRQDMYSSIEKMIKNFPILETFNYSDGLRIGDLCFSPNSHVIMVKKSHIPFILSEILIHNGITTNILSICEAWITKDSRLLQSYQISQLRYLKVKIKAFDNLLDEILKITRIPKFDTFEKKEEFENVILSEWFNESKKGSFL